MIEVMHVITGLSTGGAEMTLFKLTQDLQRRGYKQSVVSLMDKGSVGAAIEEIGVPVQILEMRRGIISWMNLHKLHRLIHDHHPDLIQGWMYHANVSATLAARGRVPVVWGIRQSLYELERERLGTRLVILFGPAMARRCTRIVYNSHTSARQHETRGYPEEKTLVIGNGFDLKKFRPDAQERARVRAELGVLDGTIVLGHVARYHPMKDHRNLIDAFVIIARRWPDVCLVMAGFGVDRENRKLWGYVQDRALAGRVRLLGERHDIASLMKGFDVYVSSAWSEGFPNVLGEAMASAVTCVATDVGDSASIVGDTGWIVPRRDPQALADALSHILSMSTEARIRLGEQARERLGRKYSLSAVGDAYQRLYEEVATDRLSGKNSKAC